MEGEVGVNVFRLHLLLARIAKRPKLMDMDSSLRREVYEVLDGHPEWKDWRAFMEDKCAQPK
jgi:hypothetical protein